MNITNLKTMQTVVITAFVMALIFLLALNKVNANEQTNYIAKQLQATFKNTTFTNIGTTTIDGIYQVEMSNEIIYFSPKAEVLFFGQLFNKNGVNLTEQQKQQWQAKRISQIDTSDALIIGNGSMTIIEFSDPDCPFCQKFDTWITNQNITQNYTRKVILTPIDSLHPNAHKEAVHVLCSDDPVSALSQVLNNQISYADMLDCPDGQNQLKKHRAIAKAFGITATPTLIINGILIQGFNLQKITQIINDIKLKQKEEI